MIIMLFLFIPVISIYAQTTLDVSSILFSEKQALKRELSTISGGQPLVCG
jgi:hypothetical protein